MGLCGAVSGERSEPRGPGFKSRRVHSKLTGVSMDGEPEDSRLSYLFLALRGLAERPSENTVLADSETGIAPSPDDAQGARWCA